MDEFTDPLLPKRKVMAQGVNILRSIIEAYNQGALDDPQQSANLCSLFALVAEGKVIGHFDNDSATTKWSLTDNYIKRLREVEDSILESKLLKGPWKNSLDPDVNT